MKLMSALVVSVLMVSAPAFASKEIAGKNACMGCHAADKKIVGPSYQDIAAKYKGQADAIDKLAKKVKAGGSGVWGPIPMPAHPQVKEEDIKTIVHWVLSL
jgi:cytochrome c